MKLDTHVHTVHSGKSTHGNRCDASAAESYNSVEGVYRTRQGARDGSRRHHRSRQDRRRADHRGPSRCDRRLRGDRRVSRDGVRVHLGVLGLSEAQHRGDPAARRHDIRELLPYLRQEGLFTSLNHVASRINGASPPRTSRRCCPGSTDWKSGTARGCRARTAPRRALAAALRQGGRGRQRLAHRPRHRTHLGRGAAARRNRAEFLDGLRAGRVHRRRTAGALLHDGRATSVASPPASIAIASGCSIEKPRTGGAMRCSLGGHARPAAGLRPAGGRARALRPRGAVQPGPAGRPGGAPRPECTGCRRSA